MKFLDDKCTIHDLSDNFVASSLVCHGLYRLDAYEKCASEIACTLLDMYVMPYEKLWHACFGHLNFSSLLCLHKSDMVLLLPNLKAPKKHVCKGCILGKIL